MSVAVAVFAARMGDLLREAKSKLPDDEFADLIVLLANALSKHFGDACEGAWGV